MLTVVLVVWSLLLVAVAWFLWFTSGSVLRRSLHERVLVTLKSGEGFEGVLFRADRRSWELVQAKAVGAGDRGADVPVDGALVIPADNVAFCQRP